MRCVEILFCLFEPALEDVDFGDGQEAWEQEDRVISTQFILFVGDEFVDTIMSLLQLSLENLLFGFVYDGDEFCFLILITIILFV